MFAAGWLRDRHGYWRQPERTASLLGYVLDGGPITGSLVPDAQRAALATEHGLVVMTTGTDFERFSDARWRNPL